jgi:hypothetical protein
MTAKTCIRCGVEYNGLNWRQVERVNRKDGTHTGRICYECHKKQVHEWQAANRDRMRANARRYNELHKDELKAKRMAKRAKEKAA